MANIHAPMYANRLLQDTMDNVISFGNKVIILGEDIRQVLPLVPHSLRVATVKNSIQFSPF